MVGTLDYRSPLAALAAALALTVAGASRGAEAPAIVFTASSYGKITLLTGTGRAVGTFGRRESATEALAGGPRSSLVAERQVDRLRVEPAEQLQPGALPRAAERGVASGG